MMTDSEIIEELEDLLEQIATLADYDDNAGAEDLRAKLDEIAALAAADEDDDEEDDEDKPEEDPE